ncbi:MAG: hypothetical protein IPN90_02535 [Elusimicrobia bacterium]|nr:hypothetical protein [Elusimicrobiota bacterium]
MKLTWRGMSMALFGAVMVFTGSVFASEIPVGKKVQIHLKSGTILEGVIYGVSKDQKEISLVDFTEPVKIASIQKIIILRNQTMVPIEKEGAGQKADKKPHYVLGETPGGNTEHKVHFFCQIETWSTADAFKESKEATKEILNDPSLPFNESSVEIESGVGGRIGFLASMEEDGYLLGGSLGYIKGPTGTFTFSDGNSPPNNEARIEEKTSFIRIMAEGRKHFTLNKTVGIRLGAGLGFAIGNIEDTYTFFINPFRSSMSQSQSWTGLTWELTPSILFKAGETNIEFGITYASLPTLGENDDFYEFKWNPLGLHLGLGF